MDITAQDIQDFKEIYKKYFAVELNDDSARRKLYLLVNQFRIIFQPINPEQLEEPSGGKIDARN